MVASAGDACREAGEGALKLALAATIAVLWWVSAAAAAEPDAGSEPEPGRYEGDEGVESSAEEGQGVGEARRQLPAARVRAFEMAELPEDPTSFSTIIRPDDHRGKHETVSNLLAASVGVQVRHLGGPGEASEISIRGSTNAQVVVELDGLRLNSAQTGAFDLSAIPLSMVEQIQVARGGGSLQAGSAAIGGVVNLVPISPGKEPVSNASFSGGSFGTFQGSLSHARRFGQSDLVAGYDGFRTKGNYGFQSVEIVTQTERIRSRPLTRINSESSRHVGWLRLGHDFGSGMRLTVSDYLSYQSRGAPGLDVPPGDEGGQNADAHQRVTRNLLDLKLQADELWQGRLSAQGRVYGRYDRSHYTDPTPIPITDDPIDNLDRNWEVGARVELETDLRSGPVGHAVALGFEARRDAYSSNRAASQGRWVVSATLQDEARFFDDRLSLTPGLRFEWAEGQESQWLPRLGVGFELAAGVRLKANVERSYRLPNFNELYFDQGPVRGNPNLLPETALNADVGLELAVARWGPWLTDASLEAAVFVNDLRNSIVFQARNAFVVEATNTGPARIFGLELAGSLRLFHWLDLVANWTWLDTSVEDPPSEGEISGAGRVLPGRAESQWFIRAAVNPRDSAGRASFEVQHTGRIPTSFSGASYVSGRTVLNASLSYDVAVLIRRVDGDLPWLPDDLVASLTLSNFTDQSVRDAVGFPQPGRTFSFQLKSRW